MASFENPSTLASQPESLEEPEKGNEDTKKREKAFPALSPEEEILMSDEVKLTEKLLEGAPGPVAFVEIKDDGAGIFKEIGCKKERAAYIVDRLFGFNMVPPTVLRDIKGKRGSLQQFVPDTKFIVDIDAKEVPDQELMKLGLFDFFLGNFDRNPSNFLIKDRKIFAIDHALAFWPGPPFLSAASFLDSRYLNFFGQPVPEEIKKSIIEFSTQEEEIKRLRDSLEELLNEEEVDTFFKRLEYLIQCVKRGQFFSREEYIAILREFY